MNEDNKEMTPGKDWNTTDANEGEGVSPKCVESTPERQEEMLDSKTTKTPDDVEIASSDHTPDGQDAEQLMQRLLRVSADYENFKKRTSTNIQTSLEQQLISITRDLLPVLDHFDRALEVDLESTTTQGLLEGVQLVWDELIRMLNRYGINRIRAAKGDPFDPNCHEALMRQPAEGVESDHIATQIQPGYALNNKTIRPAGVTVAE